MSELTQLIQNLTDLQTREAADLSAAAQRKESFLTSLLAINEASQATFDKFLDAFSRSKPPQPNIPSHSYHISSPSYHNCPNFPSFEVESIPTGVEDTDVIHSEELVEYSINSELRTDFSENSKEEDDSLKLELIPQYFFVETEDADSLTSMSLPIEEVDAPEIMGFAKLNSAKLDKTCDSKMDSSMDFITHLQLNCKHYSFLRLGFTSSIFDRGKEFEVMKGFSHFVGYPSCVLSLRGVILIDTYNEDCIYKMILRLGYPPDFQIMDSLVLVYINGANINGDRKLFVKMSDRNRIIILVLTLVREVDTVQGFIGAMADSVLRSLTGGFYFNLSVAYTYSLFDRGKALEISKGNSYYCDAYNIHSDLITILMGSILMANYKAYFVHNLVIKHGSASYSLLPNSAMLVFVHSNDIVDSGKLLVKSSQRNNIFGNTLSSLVVKCNMEYVNELIFRHGCPPILLFEGSIVFVVLKEVANDDGCKLLTPRLQQGKALYTFLLLSIPTESGNGKVKELFCEMHHTGIWSFGYGGVCFSELLHEVFAFAKILSTQVTGILNTNGHSSVLILSRSCHKLCRLQIGLLSATKVLYGESLKGIVMFIKVQFTLILGLAKVMGFRTIGYTGNFLLCCNYRWGLVYKEREAYTIGYLKWKFRLFSADLRGKFFCPKAVPYQVLGNCVFKLNCVMLKIYFGFTTKYVTTGQFWAQQLFTIFVGSVVWSLSGGADNILWITHAFSNARKFFVGEFVEVSMGVFTHVQLHIPLLLFRSPSKLLLLFFSTMIVQAHLVCPPTSGYVQLEFYGRKKKVQLFHTVIHTLAVWTSVVCARIAKWINLEFTSAGRVGFQILEQLEDLSANGNQLQQRPSNFEGQLNGILCKVGIVNERATGILVTEMHFFTSHLVFIQLVRVYIEVLVHLKDSHSHCTANSRWIVVSHRNFTVAVLTPAHSGIQAHVTVSRSAVMMAYQARNCDDGRPVYCWYQLDGVPWCLHGQLATYSGKATRSILTEVEADILLIKINSLDVLEQRKGHYGVAVQCLVLYHIMQAQGKTERLHHLSVYNVTTDEVRSVSTNCQTLPGLVFAVHKVLTWGFIRLVAKGLLTLFHMVRWLLWIHYWKWAFNLFHPAYGVHRVGTFLNLILEDKDMVKGEYCHGPVVSLKPHP